MKRKSIKLDTNPAPCMVAIIRFLTLCLVVPERTSLSIATVIRGLYFLGPSRGTERNTLMRYFLPTVVGPSRMQQGEGGKEGGTCKVLSGNA